MPAPVPDEDYKRRARRRLIGAVALAIVAVILLPLVLQDEPPPAGPLDVRMPAPMTMKDSADDGKTVEYAPPASNTSVEPAPAEEVSRPAPPASPNAGDSAKTDKQRLLAPAAPTAPAATANKGAEEAKAGSFTIQVGVFADKTNVQRLQSRIASLGMTAYTEPVGDATRIRVGGFASKPEADAAVTKLTAVGIPGKVVEK
jgi:DedD protein